MPAQVERAELIAKIAADVHALCQPLTALQCRLELAKNYGESIDDLAEWLGECLQECARMNLLVHSMHESVQRACLMDQEETR